MPPPPPPPPPSRPAAIFAQPSSYATSAHARHLAASAASVALYGGHIPAPTQPRTERDILEAHHRFLRDEDDDGNGNGGGDEERALAKRYYDKLFKEFAVVELGRWRERMVALRWRTKDEVLAGKGDRVCARLGCSGAEGDGEEAGEGRLREFEMNFEYVEQGTSRNALVKVRVCGRCARKLRYAQRRERERSRSRSRSRDRGKRNEKKRRSEEKSGEEEDRNRGRHRHRRRRREDSVGDAEEKEKRRRHHRQRRESRSRSPEKDSKRDLRRDPSREDKDTPGDESEERRRSGGKSPEKE